MPGFGYGINYEFGLFRQTFVNGYQHEKPDHWLDEDGSPWLIDRADEVDQGSRLRLDRAHHDRRRLQTVVGRLQSDRRRSARHADRRLRRARR